MTNLVKWSGLAVIIPGLMAVAAGQADAGLTVYVTADDGGNTVLGTLNLSTGQYSQVAMMSIAAYTLTAGANGTLYAGGTDGHLYTVNSSTGATTQFGTGTAPPGAGGLQQGYFGLAYAGASGFYAANPNSYVNSSSITTLDQISSTGNNVSVVGPMGSPADGDYSGGLAFGPNGTLYNASENASGVECLFSVNTTTGLATQIGSGLGVIGGGGLGLVTIGGTLYGIDENQYITSGPYDIYTVNTTTGLATDTGVTITGDGNYEIDAVAYPTAVPGPSSLTLCAVAGVVRLVVASLRRKRAA